jgi:hypothetical protein
MRRKDGGGNVCLDRVHEVPAKFAGIRSCDGRANLAILLRADVDTVTGRVVAIGRHEKLIVMIPYELKGRTLTPVTIHATSRQQINSRIKSGRFKNE